MRRLYDETRAQFLERAEHDPGLTADYTVLTMRRHAAAELWDSQTPMPEDTEVAEPSPGAAEDLQDATTTPADGSAEEEAGEGGQDAGPAEVATSDTPAEPADQGATDDDATAPAGDDAKQQGEAAGVEDRQE